jgi:uncharacterized membrane protein YhaH (DUF805 family)
LICILGVNVVILLGENIASPGLQPLFQGLSVLAAVIIGLIGLALTIARFHDAGFSGWWSLLVFIPIVNLFVVLFLLFWPSTDLSPDAAGNARARTSKS